MRNRQPQFRLAMLVLLLAPAARAGADTAGADGPVDFDRDVRPIFASHCFECHGPDKAKGGLRLNDRQTALNELESGERAVVPGKPEESALVSRVTSDDPEEQMPPKGKGERLKPQEVETLRRWIVQGAEWQVHWSYRPVVRHEPPATKRADWGRGPIDQFVLAKLADHGLTPSPEAERHTLAKRLYYDLLGLTPEPEEVGAFLGNESPSAYEKLVDKLLGSPHFGERWGRHWLDKARYADSDGYEKDGPRPDAYRFRDWVIDAVNRDLPFDRFTVEQIAGDLLPGATTDQKVATAFHRQTLTNKEGGVDAEQWRVEAVFDRAETTGAVWLGLTVGCARCHTHKYDAITHKEYYQLFAFFNNADEVDLPLAAPREALAKHQKDLEQHRAKVKELQAKVAAATQPAAKDGTTAEPDKDAAKQLREQLAALKKNPPKPPTVPVRVIGQRTKDPRPTRVLRRGDFLQPTDPASPGVLASLHPLRPRQAEGADRLDLAHWLVDPANPVTARVAANDLWLHLFGHGLVRTPDDFGVRGEKPTHPELLDWLSDEYRRLGWSRKAMIKAIVMSATYRQSSRHRPELADRDPENRLLHRQNRFRVEGEIVRDVALSASGLLSRKIGGPSVFPPMPADVAALSYANNFKWKNSEGEDRYRRGMYTFFKRTAPHPDLTAFDCPDSNAAVVKRSVSNTPLQALTALNNESFHEAAQALAKRVLSGSTKPTDDGERLAYAFRLCLLREPSSEERASFADLLARSRAWYGDNPDDAKTLVGKYQREGVAPDEAAAWVATARVLLNMDEFLTRE